MLLDPANNKLGSLKYKIRYSNNKLYATNSKLLNR